MKESRASRASYIKAKLSVLIPAQLRALRLKSDTPKQEDLARVADMKQSRISAMEKPGAVNFNLETLVRMASTFKVGLIVQFVSFSEMLRWENDFSQDTFDVATLENDVEFIEGEVAGVPVRELALALSRPARGHVLEHNILGRQIIEDLMLVAPSPGYEDVLEPSRTKRRIVSIEKGKQAYRQSEMVESTQDFRRENINVR